MWQRILQAWRNNFGLDQRNFRFWLVNLGLFLLIGLFVITSQGERGTYLLVAVLMAVNSLILFSLHGEITRLTLAALVVMTILNAVTFGYYYFSSISVNNLIVSEKRTLSSPPAAIIERIPLTFSILV